MTSPFSDDQDDLDRTDKLPVLRISEAAPEFPEFDPSATVVIDPAVQARVEELETRLAERDGELAGLRETLQRRGEVDAEIENQVERLRAQLRSADQRVAELAGAAERLADEERSRAALEVELQRLSGECADLRASRDESVRARERVAGELQAERASLQEEIVRLGAEARRLQEEIGSRQAASAQLDAERVRLGSELVAVRGRLESELRDAGERFRTELEGLRGELAREREAHRALRDERTALEQEKLQQAARQGDEVAGMQLEVARLERELGEARDAGRTQERDLAVARRESGRVAALRAGLERTIREREAQIEALLERLRSREARQRMDDDLRESARSASRHALEEMGLAGRLAAIEQALGARDTANAALESRLTGLLQQLATAQEELATATKAAAQATSEAAAAHAAAIAAQAAAAAETRARIEAEARERAAEEARRNAEAAAAQASAGGSRYLTRIDDESGVVYMLAAPRIVVGRGKNCDLVVAESYVSGRHALLRLGPELTVVEDSGSTNGVFVNGRRVRREELRDGDVVSFGRARFRFHSRGPVNAGG